MDRCQRTSPGTPPRLKNQHTRCTNEMYNILYLCSFPQNNRDMKLHNFHNMGYDSGVVHFPFLPFTCFANWHHVPALPLTCVVELTTHHVGVLVVPGAGTDSSPDTVLHHRHPPSLVLVPERAVLQTQLQGCKGKKIVKQFLGRKCATEDYEKLP